MYIPDTRFVPGTQAHNVSCLIEVALANVQGHALNLVSCDTPRMRERFRKHLSQHPPRTFSQSSAAAHEAGHFVTYQAIGLGATHAALRNLGNFGWVGRAWCSQRITIFSPAVDILYFIVAMLAGPFAEEMHGDGSCRAIENFEEVLAANLLTRYAVGLNNPSASSVWKTLLVEAAAQVEFYADEIREVGSLLAKRSHIQVADKDVKRIIERIDSRPSKSTSYDKTEIGRSSALMIVDVNDVLREFNK